VPWTISFNNMHQFNRSKIRESLKYFKCQAQSTTIAHPQTNSQAEAANKVILHDLHKKLDDAKAKWIDELPGILWSIHTIEKNVTARPLSYLYLCP